MKRRFFSGSTLDQAVMMASRHYGVDPAQLAYRQIEKKHGFLRTRKAVMISVDPEQPDSAPRSTGESAVAEAPPAAPVATSEPAAEIEPLADAGGEPAAEAWPDDEPDDEPDDRAWPGEGLDDQAPAAAVAEPVAAPEPEVRAAVETEPPMELGDPPADPTAADDDDGHEAEHDEELLDAAERAAQILMRFGGIDAEASADSGRERVEVDLEGPDTAVLVVENGTGLLAIQHLLPRMMRGLTGRSSFVRVDSEGFHQKRKERLQALAVKEAEAVSRDGAPRTLPPMAPDERRIVHLAVQKIPTVITESRGSGLHKRIVIQLDVTGGGHDDIEARHGF